MLLAIDVGNTNIVLGVFDGERLADSWRLATLRERTADELGILVTHLFEQSGVDRTAINGIILSSVVPPLTRHDGGDGRALFRPDAADRRSRRPTPACRCSTRRPSDVGADRVVNAVAAYETFGRAEQRADHRRRLRHGDDVRCDLGRGRVHRRRHLSRASAFRPTRCSSARRGCRASTCASRRRSSARRP